jgi:hypothetical protein
MDEGKDLQTFLQVLSVFDAPLDVQFVLTIQ